MFKAKNIFLSRFCHGTQSGSKLTVEISNRKESTLLHSEGLFFFTAIAAEIGEPILAFRYIKLCFIDGEIQFPANTPFSRWLKVHLNLHRAPSLTLFV